MNALPKNHTDPKHRPAGSGTRPRKLDSIPSADPAGGFRELRVFAEMFADVQALRISNENRVRSASVESPLLAEQVALDEAREFAARKAMVACFERVAPDYHAWAKGTVGIGESTLARLLGCIGHPRIATPHHWEGEGAKRVLVADESYERTVSQLWAYCGHGDPARKKRKGMTAEQAFGLGSPHAKMIVWNLAVSCMKAKGTDEAVGGPAMFVTGPMDRPPVSADHDSDPAPDETRRPPMNRAGSAKKSGDEATDFADSTVRSPRRRSPYRDTYDHARAIYLDRTHATECVRCGPSGKPALIGSPWSDGHQNAAALRLTGKEILRDLWLIRA